MEDKKYSANTVWLMVRHWIANITEGMGGSLSSTAKLILEDMHISTKLQKLKGFWKVIWNEPLAGWLKLNIDSSCQG